MGFIKWRVKIDINSMKIQSKNFEVVFLSLSVGLTAFCLCRAVFCCAFWNSAWSAGAHMYTFFAEDTSEAWRMSKRACETWLKAERGAQISKLWLQHQAWWRHSVRLRSAWGMSSKSLLSKHFCIAPFLGHINCRCVCSISFLSFSPSFSWSINGNNPHLSTKTVSLQENVETGCGLQHVCWEAEWSAGAF